MWSGQIWANKQVCPRIPGLVPSCTCVSYRDSSSTAVERAALCVHYLVYTESVLCNEMDENFHVQYFQSGMKFSVWFIAFIPHFSPLMEVKWCVESVQTISQQSFSRFQIIPLDSLLSLPSWIGRKTDLSLIFFPGEMDALSCSILKGSKSNITAGSIWWWCCIPWPRLLIWTWHFLTFLKMLEPICCHGMGSLHLVCPCISPSPVYI